MSYILYTVHVSVYLYIKFATRAPHNGIGQVATSVTYLVGGNLSQCDLPQLQQGLNELCQQ